MKSDIHGLVDGYGKETNKTLRLNKILSKSSMCAYTLYSGETSLSPHRLFWSELANNKLYRFRI